MIIEEFSFGNFRSFKDIQSLNMTAAKIKSKNPQLDIDNVISINDKLSLLKSKAIYGANASGKSNVIKALVAFINIINYSFKEENILAIIDAFRLSTETEKSPSFFQLIFRYNNIKYRYGFELSENQVYAEWLFATPNIREIPYFIRENNKIIELDKTNFKEGQKLLNLLVDDEPDESEIFRKNSLFLTVLSSFGFGKLSKELINAISEISIISGLGNGNMYGFAGESLNDKDTKKFILDFLKYGDTGIEDLEIIKVTGDDVVVVGVDKEDFDDEAKLILSKRNKYNEKSEIESIEYSLFNTNESEGTQKLFELSPFIYSALKEGHPLIIDEFDARFHPLLTKKIVELFNSTENKNAQLIFITHDTNMLSAEMLRRDQIDFVEKDKYGASHLYTLVQFKGIRNNASFEKDYIQGKYGAIPFLGNFDKLINLYQDA